MSPREAGFEPSQPEHHEQVLESLAKSGAWIRGGLEAVLREVTEAAAHTMKIDRVNVWLFDDHRTKIRCIEHFDRVSEEHSPSGAELTAADYPRYFQALDEERTIVAHHAQTDQRTREFTEGYLEVHGITSMLDAPLHSGGDVIGIICHEHVGEARIWTGQEQRFAGSLADLASLALESKERTQVEGALRQSEQLTRQIITGALDAIIIANQDGIITDWNPRAETVFGWSRAEAIGMKLSDAVIPPRLHEDHRKGMEHYLATGEGPILNRRIEVTARDKRGREFPAELTVSPVHIGDELAFSAFVRDITDRVLAELEVHKLNAELEERVHERTAQLRAAIAEKERLLDELQVSSVELVDRLCELEHKSETIRTDLERAQVIQTALLPAAPPSLNGVHVNVLYRPGMRVGGDLYDVTQLADGRLALYVADAAGHGVAAAMLSVLFKQRLRMADEEGNSLAPPDVLRRVNAQLAGDVAAQGLFLTVAYVLLDTKTGECQVASAGHTPMLLRKSNGESVFLKRTGPALGLSADARFTEHKFTFRHGDRLILYTDGLVDGLPGTSNDQLRDLLVPVLSGETGGSPHRLRNLFRTVDHRIRENHRESGRDDVTLLILEADGGPCSFDNDPEDESEESPTVAQTENGRAWALWIAETEAETHLVIRGRGTWLHSESFRRLAQVSIVAEKRLTIDLTDCTYLDSAFLGTLHEVITADSKGTIAVRGPSAAVRELFVELGLERVLNAILDRPGEPPCEPSPVTQDPPARASQQRLLRAHEILSELSEENRIRFEAVVKSLRVELGSGS